MPLNWRSTTTKRANTNHRVAIAGKKSLDLLELGFGNADAAAIAQHQPVAAIIADGVADIVAEHAGGPADQQQQIQKLSAPCDAAIAPAISSVSPGVGIPKSSRKMPSATAT